MIYILQIKETNVTRLCQEKTILAVNGQFPGPTIYARKDDVVIVNVYNQGNKNITLHWHGVDQPRNPWSDGPEYITQCPIQPGANFTYKIIFTEEEGTLWWHAHSDFDRATVHGAIVIHPKRGSAYPYPRPHRCPSSSASGGTQTWSKFSWRPSRPAATSTSLTPTPSTASLAASPRVL